MIVPRFIFVPYVLESVSSLIDVTRITRPSAPLAVEAELGVVNSAFQVADLEKLTTSNASAGSHRTIACQRSSWYVARPLPGEAASLRACSSRAKVSSS